MTIALNLRMARPIAPEYLDYWPQTHVWQHEDRGWIVSCHTALGYQINGDHEEWFRTKEEALDMAQAYMDSDRTGAVWEYTGRNSHRLIRIWSHRDNDYKCITGDALADFLKWLGIYGQ